MQSPNQPAAEIILSNDAVVYGDDGYMMHSGVRVVKTYDRYLIGGIEHALHDLTLSADGKTLESKFGWTAAL